MTKSLHYFMQQYSAPRSENSG